MSNEEVKTPMIYCENLVKLYKIGDIEVMALQGLDLQVEEGEMLAIIGNSGSGKSTLMKLLLNCFYIWRLCFRLFPGVHEPIVWMVLA